MDNLKQLKSDVSSHKDSTSPSFVERFLLFLNPVSNPSLGKDSLIVNITSRGVKLDLDSLLVNDKVTKQVGAFSRSE